MAPGVGVFALLTLLLATGLYHMHAWGRFLSSALCWIALVLIIIGYVVSPFEDIDRAAMGLAPQSWLDRVLNVSPYVMVCLWIIRTFDTYKPLFSNPLLDRHEVDQQEVRQEGVR